MKPKKFKIKIKPKKERKTWTINPRTRVHDTDSYERSKEKKALREIILSEEEEDDA